ncbi:MAG TPA: energy transducer TonB [Telluria sp.]
MSLVKTAAVGAAALILSACAHAAQDKKAVVNFASCAKPVYPAEAIKATREGTVTLKFLIGADGAVIDTGVEKSSGHPDLDEAARTAIKLCKFEPAIKKGKPVQEWLHMQYVWTLK